MLYLYDVWVNWVDGEEDGYNIYHYHEWRKSDRIEMIDQIPVLYINESMFHYIENSLSPLPNELLNAIYKKTYVRKGYERKQLTYACIVTDRCNMVAINTLGYNRPLQKSRLIPRQERQVYEMCRKATKLDYPFQREQMKRMWSINEKYMIGLTRRERQLKKLLYISISLLKKTENKKELWYWLSEWEGTNALTENTKVPIEVLWKRLYDQIVVGWSARHERFLNQLIKGNQILETLWNEERSTYKNKENQK